LTGTKVGCNSGLCGTCTVLVNGKATKSCQLLALEKTAGILTDIRIVLTGSTDIPVRLEKVESVLLGASITSNQVETALKKLEEEVLTFQSEPAIDEAYLRHLIKVLLKKSIIKP
jgi:xanthine dehydrogenase iron-sulfur cluster and FAD-binding subunit A